MYDVGFSPNILHWSLGNEAISNHNHMATIYLRLQTLVPKISVTGRAQVIGEMPRHALFWSTLMNNLTQLCPPASLAILQAWWRLTLTDRQEVTTRSLNHLALRFTGNSDDEKFHSTFSEGRRRRGCLPGSESSQKLRLRVAVDLLRVVADTEWKWMQFFIIPPIWEYTITRQGKSCGLLHQGEIKNGESCHWTVIFSQMVQG